MPRPLHSLLLAVLTALLLVQPAVVAGASCAEEMFTGQCGCTEPDAAGDARSCCAPQADEGALALGALAEGDTLRPESPCDCSLAPVPHAPAAPAHDAAGLTTEGARSWIGLCAALPASSALDAAPAPRWAASDGAPPAAALCPHDLASRGGAARYLTFLCTSLR
jgi:hypothetical protein